MPTIGYHRSNGETNIARATRRANRHPNDLLMPDAVAPGARRISSRRSLNVRYEVIVVDGPEGKLLRQQQAVAMREVVRWLHANPAPPSPAGHEQYAPQKDV